MLDASPVADLILALGRLLPEGESAIAIARCLGLALGEDAEEKRVAPSPAQAPVASAPAAAPTSRRARPAVEPATPAAAVPGQTNRRKLQLHNVTFDTAPAPQSLPLLAEAAPFAASELPFEPLVRPLVTRAVVSSALARRTPTGEIDVSRLAELMARRKRVSVIPRRTWASVAPWTRVLIDCGPGMTPFARDASDFAERICAVASRERSEVLPFWQGPKSEESAPPRPGTAVLAISELGIARSGSYVPSLMRDWLELAESLRARDCSLCIFVPYPSPRWPQALSEKLCLVTWDRRTSLADVRVALGAQRSFR